MRETSITLKENVELAQVTKRFNGFIVQDRKIRVDDLLASFLEVIEPVDLLDLLLNHNEMMHVGLGEWISEQDEKRVSDLLRLIFEYISVESDNENLVEILKVFANRFDLSSIDEKRLNQLLQLFLHRTNSLENPEVYNQLFITLLKKVQISDPSSGEKFLTEVLTETLERAEKERHLDLLEKMFYLTAKKSRDKWIKKILSPYLSEVKVYKSPILPMNCVLFQELADGSKTVVIELEKQKIHVDYHLTSFENVGHPKLWFEFNVNENSIRECRIFALKDPVIKPTSKIYHYPYSNVFNDFRACWPELRNLKIQGIHQLSTLPYLFLRSPSNDHLFRGKNLRELYAKMQNEDFDNSLLESSGKDIASIYEL